MEIKNINTRYSIKKKNYEYYLYREFLNTGKTEEIDHFCSRAKAEAKRKECSYEDKVFIIDRYLKILQKKNPISYIITGLYTKETLIKALYDKDFSTIDNLLNRLEKILNK